MFIGPFNLKLIDGKAYEILRTDSEKPYSRDKVFEFTFKSTIWKVLQYLKVFEDKPILFLVFHLTKQSDDVDYPAAFSILQDEYFNDYFVNLKTALPPKLSVARLFSITHLAGRGEELGNFLRLEPARKFN